jgi:hypothetical protein
MFNSIKSPNEYTLPRGKIKRKEDHASVALNKLKEKYGVYAMIYCSLDTVEYKHDDTSGTVKYYLLEEIYSCDS